MTAQPKRVQRLRAFRPESADRGRLEIGDRGDRGRASPLRSGPLLRSTGYAVIELKTTSSSPNTPASSTSTSRSSTTFSGANITKKPSASSSAAPGTTVASGTAWDAPPHPWRWPRTPTTSSRLPNNSRSLTRGTSQQPWNGQNQALTPKTTNLGKLTPATACTYGSRRSDCPRALDYSRCCFGRSQVWGHTARSGEGRL